MSSPQLSDSQRHEVKKHLLKSYVYRFIAHGLVGVGAILFFVFFVQFADADFTRLLRNPVLLGTIILSFLPSLLFFYFSKRARSRANKTVQQIREQGGMTSDKKRTDLYSAEKLVK